LWQVHHQEIIRRIYSANDTATLSSLSHHQHLPESSSSKKTFLHVNRAPIAVLAGGLVFLGIMRWAAVSTVSFATMMLTTTGGSGGGDNHLLRSFMAAHQQV